MRKDYHGRFYHRRHCRRFSSTLPPVPGDGRGPDREVGAKKRQRRKR
jgi:hypothetical protein